MQPTQPNAIKILALIGSGRKNGNTSRIVQLAHDRLRQVAAEHQVPLEFETVYLADEGVGACLGCRACMHRGEEKCPVKDGFLALKGKMQAADGLIAASPVYVDNVSGMIKNWMDRLGHVCHRPEFAGKCAYAIATTGNSPTGHTLGALTQALTLWGYTVAGKSGFITGGLMETEKIQAQFEKEIHKIALGLFQAIYRRKYENPSFRSLLTFRIQQRCWQRAAQLKSSLDAFDIEYWDERGWLDPKVDFYIPHRAARAKVILARLAGDAIAPFVS